MNNKTRLQKKRAETGKDLSQRNFRTTMMYLRCTLRWKKSHLVGSAMLIYYWLENLALRLLVWRKAYEPHVVDVALSPNVM